jgi:hypothetical protein
MRLVRGNPRESGTTVRQRLKRLWRTARHLGPVVATAVLAVVGAASSASAHTGTYELFNNCPVSNPEVFKCVNATTYGGEIVLGKKTTPIVNPVILQGGYSTATRAQGRLSRFFGASNGLTLSKTPEPVPGGLLGLVPPTSSPPAIKQLSAYYSAHNMTGVNGVVELAEPATSMRISEFNTLSEEGMALRLPVKIRLENQLLGSSCYIGSNSSPIVWELTSGSTEATWFLGINGLGERVEEQKIVPPPNKPIHGVSGFGDLDENAVIAGLGEDFLVENRWSAPVATGCGGALAPIIDPLIDAAIGLPSPAGRNTVILKSNIYLSASETVIAH